MPPNSRLLPRRPLAVALACLATAAHGTTITVTSSDDTASFVPCNLRNAITAINYGNAVFFPGCGAALVGAFGDNDTIVFAANLAASTITLQQGQLSNYAPLTINGSGQTIDAAGASRVLYTIAFLSLSNLTLSGGNAGAAAGGGLYASQAFVSLNNVSVSANHSAASGGGVAIANGSANLINTKLTGNSSSGGHGGAGVFVTASNVTLTNSTVSDNTATCAGDSGGAIEIMNGSTFTVTASTIARNAVAASGGDVAGAIHAAESKVSLINSTVAGNNASGQDFVAGAVIENQSSAVATHGVALTNTTVSSNTATTANAAATSISGGVLIGAAGTGRATLANAILAANSAMVAGNPAATPDLNLRSGAVTATNCLFGSALLSAYSGNGNIFSDAPGLAPLANRGGPTETMALLGGSATIDAGSNALAVNATGQPLTTDQRGFARIVNGTVDIGAFEFPGDHIFSDGFGP